MGSVQDLVHGHSSRQILRLFLSQATLAGDVEEGRREAPSHLRTASGDRKQNLPRGSQAWVPGAWEPTRESE